MTVKIPLNDHLKGYKYYQAVYLGDPLERFDAVVEGDFLVFETDHLSQYAILGSNTPFETSEKPTDPTDPTDPTTPTDPTDPAGPTDPTTPTDPADPAVDQPDDGFLRRIAGDAVLQTEKNSGREIRLKEGYSFRPGCLNRRTGERMA